ncbi:hypothetical protein MVEN_01042000 [Mycena venus]|uniref:DUF6534 domain-containing protein n=1 Tax=Mycena venus TaxID=2733690 RepID=A0A8H6YEI9_9AGAR|nr:hypothetical protein MVEN_01042000 [Mycena venus]
MPSTGFDVTLGPIINSAFFTVFFFGVITMQTNEYIRNHFEKDPLYIKSFVLFLWLIQVLFTLCICQGAYTMSVTDFGEAYQLLFTPWGLNAAVIIGSVIDHSVQAFFVMRVYRVTGALYVSICLWTMVAFLQAVSLKLAQESIRVDSIVLVGHNSSWLLSALFFGDASLDVVMASVLIYYLKKQSRSAFKSTAALLNRLVRYTIQTGLATSFVAIGAALSFKFSPNYYIWTAFLISMPGSFTIALLANINSRRSFIKPPATSVTTGTNPLESGVVITYSRDVMFSRDPVLDIRLQQDSKNRTVIVEEPHNDSVEHSIYGTNNVVV